MNVNDPLVLYILLRQSLHLDNSQTAHCAANAIQYLLMKYFTLQVVAVKTNIVSLINDDHLKTTTKWLSSTSKKSIISIDDSTWEKLKHDFNVGRDLFCLKDGEAADVETTMILWPSKYSCVPSYIRELERNT